MRACLYTMRITGVLDALGFVGRDALTVTLRRLRRTARYGLGDAKFQIGDDAAAQNLGQFGQNIEAQVKQLLLPDGVFGFHDQRPAHQRLRASVHGDALAHRGRPGGERQLVG